MSRQLSNKHPKCECGTTRFSYFRRRYKNGTFHMFRKCPSCQKVAQNALRQDEYDANWVSELPVSENGVMEQPVQSRAERSTRQSVKPKNRVQSRVDAIHAKLQRHIESRNTKHAETEPDNFQRR